MNIDWTKATIRVTVDIQHTATTAKQEINVPVEDFVVWMFDAYSRRVRSEMVRKATFPAPPKE